MSGEVLTGKRTVERGNQSETALERKSALQASITAINSNKENYPHQSRT